MAKFKRRDRNVKLEYGKLVYNVDVTDEDMIDKVTKFGERAQKAADKTDEEVIKDLKDIVDVVSGDGAYDAIEKEICGDAKATGWDTLDIANYMVEEILSFRNKFVEGYGKIGNK